MNIIFQKIGIFNIPRKLKKEWKESIIRQLQGTSLVGFKQIITGKHPDTYKRVYAIYCQKDIHGNPKEIFGEISDKTNYIFGKFQIRKSDVYYLVEIGELVEIQDEFTVIINEKEKLNVVLKKL
ncbi:MAG: hypothetical protein WC875_02640 [Candidatus Absconditabacterales bacterium]|jgi:hypothetical protein